MRYAYAFLLSAIFATLAILIATGALTGIDQWSVDHLMPGGTFTSDESGALAAIVPLYGTHWGNPWSIAANIVTLPAAFVIAVLLVARRSRALAFVLVAATAVEVLCKHVLDRPALYDGAHHITGFDSSYPSGHTLRTVILVAAFAGPWAYVWGAASLVLLLLGGWHTPSDVVGGIALGLLALLGARGAARALRARGLLRGRAR
jgi:membrane-associated phospholipid phosphatase